MYRSICTSCQQLRCYILSVTNFTAANQYPIIIGAGIDNDIDIDIDMDSDTCNTGYVCRSSPEWSSR